MKRPRDASSHGDRSGPPRGPRWLGACESAPLALRLGLAWAVCAAPRAIATSLLPLAGEYRRMQDPGADAGSFLYPAFELLSAVLWRLSGETLPVAVALHLALQSLLGPLVYALCRLLRLEAGVAWLAVLGCALLPYYVATSARQPQVGLVIVAVAALLAAFLAWRARGLRAAEGVAFAGIAVAATLLRPNLLVTVAALYSLALVSAGFARPLPGVSRRAALARILASSVVLAIGLLAVAGVARSRTRSWSPFPAVAGYNLYIGHNEHAAAYLVRHDLLSLEDVIRDHGPPVDVARIEDPRARDAAYARRALDYARAHPAQTAKNTLMKAWRYWDWRLEDADRNPRLWNLAYTAPYLLYGALAALGALALWRSGRVAELGVIAVTGLSYWLPHLVFFPTIRMRMSTEFLLVILAAAGTVWLASGGRLDRR